jgi:hypothetical protein
MTSIMRLSLIMFSLFSISYFVTSVSAQQGTNPMPQDCAALHPGGAAKHVDPPQSQLDAIEAEYKANCKAGNCFLSAATYSSLEIQGHNRGEVDCFMAEGERRHDEQHEGGNHHDQGNMNQGDPCMVAPAGPDRAACYAAQGNHSNAGGNHPQGDPCMVAPAGPDRAACYAAQGNHSNAGGNHPQGDPCMVVPAGPDRVACYATQRP